ncbi:MAG: hypothetical protein QM757_34915 [Paludibaculum sp.]
MLLEFGRLERKRAAGFSSRWTIHGRPLGPAGRRSRTEEHVHLLAQVLIDRSQLVVARHLVGGHAEARQHHGKDGAVPRLQMPPDGVEDHAWVPME